MQELSLLIVSQLIFSFSRLLNVRYTTRDKVLMTILTGVIIKMSWLVGAAIGIKSVYNLDWFMISAYLISGIIGELIAFRIKL